MLIPWHIRLDGVQPHQPGLLNTVRPQIGVNPEVVDGSGEDAERPIVQEEVLISDFERVQEEVLTVLRGTERGVEGV